MMKNFNLILANIFLVFLFANNVHAQTWPPGIDSLYIVPDEPTEADEILLVIHASLAQVPCELIHDSVEIEFNENQIQIETAYWTGWGAAGCYSIDTISLGQLSAGYYDLTAYFDHEIFTDEDSLSFFVGTPTNISVNQKSDLHLNLYPNPNNGNQLVLDFLTDNITSSAQMSIYDNTGRLILANDLPNQTRHVISLPSLSQGMYYFKINHEDHTLNKKFVVH